MTNQQLADCLDVLQMVHTQDGPNAALISVRDDTCLLDELSNCSDSQKSDDETEIEDDDDDFPTDDDVDSDLLGTIERSTGARFPAIENMPMIDEYVQHIREQRTALHMFINRKMQPLDDKVLVSTFKTLAPSTRQLFNHIIITSQSFILYDDIQHILRFLHDYSSNVQESCNAEQLADIFAELRRQFDAQKLDKSPTPEPQTEDVPPLSPSCDWCET